MQPPETPVVPYAELHCHSNFSFLDGVNDPEELIEEAVRLGLDALAITDHDGFYAASRFAEAAAAYDLRDHLRRRAVPGPDRAAERGGRSGGPAPAGAGPRASQGYHRLAAAITEAQLRGDEKGRPLYDLEELAEQAGGHWLILTGCRKGAVRQALAAAGPAAAADALDRLTALFGHDQVLVELIDHGLPDRLDDQRRPGPAGRRPRSAAGGQQQRALRPARRTAGWGRRWRRSGPGAA